MTYINQIPKFEPGTRCAVCKTNLADDNDHALFPGSQRHKKRQTKKWRKFLDNKFNIRPACGMCNRITRRADRPDSRYTHVHDMLKLDSKGFKEWFNSYPGSRVKDSRWDEIDRMMIDAYESVLT